MLPRHHPRMDRPGPGPRYRRNRSGSVFEDGRKDGVRRCRIRNGGVHSGGRHMMTPRERDRLAYFRNLQIAREWEDDDEITLLHWLLRLVIESAEGYRMEVRP